MTFVDGFAFGIAAVLVSVLTPRSRTLPAPICWLGVLTGVVHLVSLPVRFALNSRPDGITGPISVVLVFVWALTVSILLLVRPVPRAQHRPAEMAAAT